VLAACVPVAAQSQTPRLEVSAGYAMLRDDLSDLSFPVGFVVDAAVRAVGWLSLVGEAGLNEKRYSAEGVELDYSLRSFMAGARASRRSGRLTGFGQFLAGPVTGRASAFDISSSHTVTGLQAGIGLDVAAVRRVGARIRFDVRRSGASSSGIEPGYQFRASIGMTFAVW
jgi:hypothetical protein